MSVFQFPNALKISSNAVQGSSCMLRCSAKGYKQLFSTSQSARNVPNDGCNNQYKVTTDPNTSDKTTNSPITIGAGIYRNSDCDQSTSIVFRYQRDSQDEFSKVSIASCKLSFNGSTFIQGENILQDVTLSGDCWMFSHFTIQAPYGGEPKTTEISVNERGPLNLGQINFNFNSLDQSLIVAKVRHRLDFAMHVLKNRSDNQFLSRSQLGFGDPSSYMHIDYWGEGCIYDSVTQDVTAGFPNAININKLKHQSGTSIPIPNLVELESFSSKIPFQNYVANYITLMNSPLETTAISEITRCIRPFGSIAFWVAPSYQSEILTMAKEFGVTVLTGEQANNEFPNSLFNKCLIMTRYVNADESARHIQGDFAPELLEEHKAVISKIHSFLLKVAPMLPS